MSEFRYHIQQPNIKELMAWSVRYLAHHIRDSRQALRHRHEPAQPNPSPPRNRPRGLAAATTAVRHACNQQGFFRPEITSDPSAPQVIFISLIDLFLFP